MSVTPHAPPPKPLPKAWPVDREDPITLTLTANAGVLVAYRGHRFLVDGLHAGGGGYSAVAPEVLGAIARGDPPFGGISALFFTHLHPDHYGKAEVDQFLAARPEAAVYFPRPEGGLLRLHPAVTVERIPIPHTGGEDAVHNMLLFRLGGRRLLFLGDAAQGGAALTAALGEAIPLDAVVCNSLFLTRREGREALLALKPIQVTVNHVPFEADDRMRNREVVARAANRCQAELPPVAVLWDPMDSVAF